MLSICSAFWIEAVGAVRAAAADAADAAAARARHGVTGAGAKIAILDTGVDISHPDLAGAAVAVANFSGSRTGATTDAIGHGTHVAGIAASRGALGEKGVAPGAQLLVAKVLNDAGDGTFDSILAGLAWAVAAGANVINMSLGGAAPPDGPLMGAIERAIAAGAIVVCAAGNGGARGDTVEAPGNFHRCVTVGACDAAHRVAPFSSRGPALDVVAQGVGIVSAFPRRRLAALSGTSMAAPYVSGLAALYIELCRRNGRAWSQASFEAALRQTALDICAPAFDVDSGAGVARAGALLETVAAPPPPARSPPSANLLVSQRPPPPGAVRKVLPR